MSRPRKPNLIFPNGNEIIKGRSVVIEWQEPQEPSVDLSEVFYELAFSEFFDPLDEPDWKTIAIVPSGTNSYEWKIGNRIKSDKCKIAVRSFNTSGSRSDYSTSDDFFSIQKDPPPSPAIVRPIPGSRHGNSVFISFDDTSLIDSFGQRAKYYIYFHSKSADIPFTNIAQAVPVGSGPIVWDTSALPPADDYVITVYLADDDGNKSSETNVENLSIFNEGFCIVDTLPPSGFVEINNADEFTRDRDVTVKLFAFDEATGVHSLRFIEELAEGESAGPAEAYAEIKYKQLSEGDGVKTLKVLFQDFSANRTSEIQRPFRTSFKRGESPITDIVRQKTFDGDVIWLSILDDPPALYRIDKNGSSLVLQTNESITSIAVLNGVAYISAETDDGRALIYRNSGTGPQEAVRLDTADTQVTSMITYQGALYFGTVGGRIYKYDETAVGFVGSFDGPIEQLHSDDALLYVVLRNRTIIYSYDTSSFQEIELA